MTTASSGFAAARRWAAAVSLPPAAGLRPHLQRPDRDAARAHAQARGLAGLCRSLGRAPVARLDSRASGHRAADRMAVAAPVADPPDTPTGADAVGHRRGR